MMGRRMNEPYSFWADLLSKFHTAPEAIQALWVIAVTAFAIAALHAITTIIIAVLKRKSDPEIELVYGICRDRTGRLMVYPEPKKEGSSPMPSLPNWRDTIS
jgi:hypothetical protein